MCKFSESGADCDHVLLWSLICATLRSSYPWSPQGAASEDSERAASIGERISGILPRLQPVSLRLGTHPLLEDDTDRSWPFGPQTDDMSSSSMWATGLGASL